MHPYALSETFSSTLWGAVLSFLPVLLIAGVLGGALNWFQRSLIERQKRRELDARGPLDLKLAEIVKLSKKLKALNGEVQAEFDLQLATTKKAQQDAKDAEAIAALNAEERRAAQAMVESAMDLALSKNGKRDRKFQIWVAIVSFAAGVVASVIVSLIFQAATAHAPSSSTSAPFLEAVHVAFYVL